MDNPLLLIIDAALVTNLVVDHLLGIQGYAAFSRKLAVAWDIVISVCAILLLSAPINYFAYQVIIIPLDADHMAIIIYAANVFLAAQLYSYLAIKGARIDPVRIHAITALVLLDSVILGAVLFGMHMTDSLLAFLLYALGSGIGFGLVLLMWTCLRARIRTAYVPAPLRGLPVLFLTLAIMSMAFTGFTGIST